MTVDSKYIQDNKYNILSESAWWKNLVFWVRNSSWCSLKKCEGQVSQGSVATLFRQARKYLNCCTKFYQYRLAFAEDMIKTFRWFLSVHGVVSKN